MEKVKLPREVAEAIGHCRIQEFSNRYILKLALDERGNTPLRDLLYRFADENFDTLVSALYDGYEVEQTPEERIKRIYERSIIEHDELGCQLDDYTTKILTRELLNILGIKIEGVNA